MSFQLKQYGLQPKGPGPVTISGDLILAGAGSDLIVGGHVMAGGGIRAGATSPTPVDGWVIATNVAAINNVEASALRVYEVASAPAGEADVATIYADDAAGKTRLRSIFGSGASQPINQEP